MNDITKNTIELINTLKSQDECSLEISKDNTYIVRIKKDDKLKYIGSKYSVERDIEKFISDINGIGTNETIIVFGLGAGEHIRYLVNNLSDNHKIFIVEPSAEIIKEALRLNEIKDLLEDDRIALCFLNNNIKKYINDFVDDYSMDNLKVYPFVNYSAIFEAEYNYLIKKFEEVKKSKKMDMDTFKTFSNEFFNNFIDNIFTLANEEFYSINQLKNLYEGKPAVIVSAGPSLTKNIHLLKEVQDKFIIICGPRTIGTLIENGIMPDFVCSVDPQDKVYTLMEKQIDLKVPLVFMDSSNSKIVKEQKGPRIIVANQGMEKYLEDMMGIKVDSLMQGGSVAHFSMGLAYYLGCSAIIFIGQDLAYTNDKFQADGTYAGEMDKIKYEYEKNKEKWDEDKNFSVYVKDIYGNPIRTSVVLKSYIDEFEELISECDSGIKFINSTEGGAHIEGTEVISLKDTIHLYGTEVINKNFRGLLNEPININEDEFTNRMFEIVNKLDIIKNACEDGMKYSDQMLYFYKENKPCNLNKVFLELDRIDEVVNNRDTFGILTYSLVSAINNIMNNEYFKAKDNEIEKELGMRLAKRSFIIYAVMLEIIEDLILFINKKSFYIDSGKDYNNYLNKDVNKSFNLKYVNIVYGKAFNDLGKLNIYTRKAVMNNMDKNISIILFDNVYISEKGFYFKFSMDNSGYFYINFYDSFGVTFYKKVKRSEKLLNDYNYDETHFYQLYIGQGQIGYCINKYGGIARREIKKINYSKEYEVYFNLEDGFLLINGEIIKINKYFIEKYILNRKLGILVSSTQDEFKLTLEDISI